MRLIFIFSLVLARVTLVLILLPGEISAQVLAPHPPLRILIVSDEVNPHALSAEELTQPGDISAALLALDGLSLDLGVEALLEIDTDQIEQATARLSLPREDPAAYDVLIYFAHRVPGGVDGQARQEAFVAAVDSFLVGGGGVVCFHHGIYRTTGKDSMQALLGAEATGAVPWNTFDGQNVIAVAPNHFVTHYGVVYAAQVSFQDPALGVPLAEYPMFNNTPDERYPSLDLLASPGEVEVLFASDYDLTSHLLGYVKRRDEWSGVVVVYQPGEYQPNALAPGSNFQVLLNTIVYAATFARGELLFGDGFESGDSTLWSAG